VRWRRYPAFGVPIGGVAQLGEHLLCKQGVTGSIPVVSTKGCGLAGWFGVQQYRGNQEFGVMGCWEPQGFLAVDPSFAFLAWNAVRAVGADLCSFAV
jgi:hypothetical protein